MEKALHSPASRMRLWLFAVACSFVAAFPLLANAGASVRESVSLDADWRFNFGPADATAVRDGAVADWEVVNLPHTWNAVDGADGGGDYARGTGWYVRRFRIDQEWAQRRIFIQFDGANRIATIFLNGNKVGEHVGGFARFRFDLTDQLKRDEENILAVQVSNTEDGMAPISADFTFFGGIYRGVSLFAIDPLHVDVMDYASDGVYVTPQQISAERADFSIAVRLGNDSTRSERVVIRTLVRDALGVTVDAHEEGLEIDAQSSAQSKHAFAIEQPRLWNGRKDPHQYTAEVTVLVDGKIRDQVRQRFGLREFHVDPNQGFFLNGTYLDLHGVNRHQDRAGKGWAISPDNEREDFAMIEEIGATAIRVAHYPQSQLWFDLADERGMVVWAEIPVVNEVPATEVYAENARQQLREMIRQNYNRPAICFWGVGNETREMGEVTGGRQQANGPASDHLIADLARLAQTEDPTRLSTYASHHRADDSRNFHTAVMGFNKYFGWYGGAAEDFAGWVDDAHRRFPALRISMSEYGAGANIRQHVLAPVKPAPDGEWHPEEYQAYLHEVYWEAMRTRPYLWGKFIWNLFDFAVDIRAEGDAPGLNDKGLVSYDRKTRKDAFYWYKANWSSAPVLYITSRRFTERPAGQTEIKIYSNAPRVELFLNGVACGAVASDTRIFRWNVELSEGPNTIVAKAQCGSTTLADECTFFAVTKRKK